MDIEWAFGEKISIIPVGLSPYKRAATSMQQSHQNKIAVLIPAYNEQMTIESVVKGCLEFIKEVFVVNDGSTDNTLPLLQGLPVTVIDQLQNKGKSESLVNGIQVIKDQGFSHIITIDADGQHDPKDIPRLQRAIELCPKKIITAARLRKTDSAPRLRLIANRIADFFISWTAGQKILDSQSGFRAYPVELVELLEHYDHSKAFVFESELLIKASMRGFGITAIAIDSCYPEDARASYFSPSRDVTNIVKMVAFYLLKRGFNLKGLWRILASKNHLVDL